MSRQPDSSSEEQGATANGLLTFTAPGASRDFFLSLKILAKMDFLGL